MSKFTFHAKPLLICYFTQQGSMHFFNKVHFIEQQADFRFCEGKATNMGKMKRSA